MAGALVSLGFNNVKGVYFLSLQESEQASWVPMVATMLQSDQPWELHKFLGNAPNMSLWRGERTRQDLRDFQIAVVNDKYEASIEVDIDDFRRDKTDQVMMRIRDLAGKAATLPQRVLTPLIEGNANGYDGVAFFASTHSPAGSNISNDISVDIVDPDNPTSAEMSGAILSAIQTMYGFKDDRGDPINDNARQFCVMTPVKYYAATTAAIANQFTSAGVSNTLINADLQIVRKQNSRLTGTAAAAGRRFYVFRMDANIRALLWQDEDIGAESFKTLGPNSDNGYFRDKISFGAKRQGNGALGRWELACRVNFT
jgi:phage major head subunit gpT-like protein